MAGKILISTAYLPPVEYFSLISGADEIFVEKEENYLKQILPEQMLYPFIARASTSVSSGISGKSA